MTGTFTHYLDHLVLDPAFQVEGTVTAGQRVGTTGVGPSFDMGVIDVQINLAFRNPARYGAPGYAQTCPRGKPLTYFTEALKAQPYPLVNGEMGDPHGCARPRHHRGSPRTGGPPPLVALRAVARWQHACADDGCKPLEGGGPPWAAGTIRGVRHRPQRQPVRPLAVSAWGWVNPSRRWRGISMRAC